MRTPCPTAGTTHALLHLINPDFNAAFSRFLLFRIRHPADPLIASQGSDVTPQCSHFGI